MSFDFADYLREARQMFPEIAAEWEMPIKRDDFVLNDYLNLTATLGSLMQATKALNLNIPANEVDSAPVVEIYAQGLVQFLLISLKQQWTHLMVLEDSDLVQLKKFPQMHLNHQFMGIQTMLLNSYHQKRQADFSHAWRSYLKLGLFELKLGEDEIDVAVRKIVG
ncbi:MAG: dUTPase [Lactobacillaceae bacterium]|jgi:dimeric dUTPase (all-alpha-NTP-PPase superfamily)|nr:dUTPase [Lactobacillaceae bacterium]